MDETLEIEQVIACLQTLEEGKDGMALEHSINLDSS